MIGGFSEMGGGEPGPRVSGEFYRAHGLGNDYLVFERAAPESDGWVISSPTVRRLCDRHRGLGSDGIVALLDPAPGDGVFPLRMFNPDGSEFERSGNGLRVLASHLHRRGSVSDQPFAVTSGGSRIEMTVHGVDSGGSYDISVEMGQAKVGLQAVAGDESFFDADGRMSHPELGAVPVVAVSVGNPHAVVFASDLVSEATIATLGGFLSDHAAFEAGTNVQLVRIRGSDEIELEIWERGVGPTTASGTSACAAAVAAVWSGRIEPGAVAVRMPGGTLSVSVESGLEVRLRGPVSEVAEGRLTEAFLQGLERN